MPSNTNAQAIDALISPMRQPGTWPQGESSTPSNLMKTIFALRANRVSLALSFKLALRSPLGLSSCMVMVVQPATGNGTKPPNPEPTPVGKTRGSRCGFTY
jgi:hypothetical protein